MSDSEDDEYILDDIKALQEVLTHKQETVVLKKEVKLEDDQILENPNLCEPSTSKTPNFYPPNSSQTLTSPNQNFHQSENESESENDEEEGEEEEEEEDNSIGDLSDPQVALNLNRKIVSLLSMAQKRLTLLLEECKRRQVLIDQKIRQRATDPLCRTLLTIAGIPYFKDKQQFPAPKNHDARIKESRGELQIINLPFPLRWTAKDRITLWKAIYSSAKVMAHEETVGKEEPVDQEVALSIAQDPLSMEDRIRNKKIPAEMIQNMKYLVGPLGSKEFDWMKIAATDFNGRHSASECRAMWNVHVHPDINKGKWTKVEDSSLKALAEEYKFQNWDAIASQLGTNRSGYQCFIKFNTRFKNNMLSRCSAWSKEEDQKLTDTVNALRTGNFIPWGEVAKLMGGRRKQQIYMRWNYSLAPNIKKGRFTEEEDRLLLQGVARFGSNFTKISVALLPHRNTAQLNDHYRTLMNEKKNNWSCEDDMKLVKLFDKLGNNWAAIAKEFENKSRVQVRHRHTAIIRYLSRGLSIRTIPRWGQKGEEKDTPEEILTKGAQMLNEMSEMLGIQQQQEAEVQRSKKVPKIDLELRDYFKGIYRTSSTKRGRNRKFYSHEELEERTKKLHVILNMLNADLNIPDDFEEEVSLTEKDKQLLSSLKTRLRNESAESEARQKHIEYVRRRMFGSSMPPAEADRFIPPLPFNGQVPRTKRRKLVGINYFPNGDKSLAEPEAELNTPDAIISLIGGSDGEIKFKNLEKLFIGRIEESSEGLSPSSSTRNGNNLAKTFYPNVPSTSSTVDNSHMEIDHSRSKSFYETKRKKRSKCDPETLIPPNYTTLLGFRGILLSKHLLESETSEEDEYDQKECTITLAGERALELFEDRLIKLFKFPIELSEVAPPLLHGVQNGEFDDTDDNRKTKRKASKTSSAPTAAKRKPQLQNVSIEKTSEAQ